MLLAPYSKINAAATRRELQGDERVNQGKIP